MSDAIAISAETYQTDFDTQVRATPEGAAARKVLEVLMATEGIDAEFSRTATQSRAHFQLLGRGRMELIRVTVRLDLGKAFIAYHDPKPWPVDWERDFRDQLGIDPQMGSAIVDWCISNPDNTDRLLKWLTDRTKAA